MTALLACAVLALLAAERSPGLRRTPLPLLRRYASSDVFYLLSGYLAGSALAFGYVVHGGRWVGALGVPRLSSLAAPLWVTVPLALLLLDLGNYASHWLLHRVGWLWAIHKVHHSSRSLDWLAAFRSHLAEQLLRRALAPLLLIAIGMPVDAVAIAAALFTIWAAVNHANLRDTPRWLDAVLVTPRLHRLHHLPATSASNLGTVLTIWDRWRGTLVTDEPVGDGRCGVPGEVDTYPQGWWRQLLAPLRGAPTNAADVV